MTNARSSRPRRRLNALALAAAGALTALGVSAPAQAQEDTFYLDRAQISGAPDDGFMVWRPYMAPKTRYYGAATLGYTLNPLRKGTVTDDATTQSKIQNPLSHQLITYLQAGMELSGRLGVNISLPVAVYQHGGDDPAGFDVGEGLERRAVALHDLRVDARLQAFETDTGLLRMGGGAALFLPTGDTESFASDGQTSGYIYGSAEFDFGPFYISGNIGPHFRPQRGIGGTRGDLFLASELRWAGGAYLPLRDGDILLGGELWGTTGIEKVPPSPSSRETEDQSTLFADKNTDFEWLGFIKLFLDEKQRWYFKGGGGTRLANGYGAPDVRVLVQVGVWQPFTDGKPTSPARRLTAPDVDDHDPDTDGDGFPDSIDLCPTVKEDGKPPDTDDGCPGPQDRDGDGFIDSEDKCPDEPEDKDGVMDMDGCPEEDPDKDGIPDAEDKCPVEPGLENDDPEKNGCPLNTKILEDSGEIQLLNPIQFETARAVIKTVSFPILDEVVALMKSRDDLRIAVHGHTDNRGGKAMNEKLSKDRAAACMKYLIGKGIKADRLESSGFGPNKQPGVKGTRQGCQVAKGGRHAVHGEEGVGDDQRASGPRAVFSEERL